MAPVYYVLVCAIIGIAGIFLIRQPAARTEKA
jgi:hypothetical protein